MLTRIDHIELQVNDVEKAASLFKKMGFKEVLRSTHHGVAIEMALHGPDQVVYELHQVAGEENPGINHIAFVADDIQKTYEQMSAKGIKFTEPPHLVKATGRVLLNTRDADGFRFQICDEKRKAPVEGEVGTDIDIKK